MHILKRNIKSFKIFAATLFLLFSQMVVPLTALTTTANATVEDLDPPENITICHATSAQSNPYVEITPANSGIFHGHDKRHDGPIWHPGTTEDWGDIIPPYTHKGVDYPGQNWPEGKSILLDGCNVKLSPDMPTLTLVKRVEGSASPTEWILTATPKKVKGIEGLKPISGPGGFEDRVVEPKHKYFLSETDLEGYQASKWQCVKDSDGGSFTFNKKNGWVKLKLNTDVTCTITNTFNDVPPLTPPTLTVIKNVVKDNGGDAGPNSFGLTQNDVSVASDQTVEYSVGDKVTINEAGLIGYEFVSIAGKDCPTQLGGSVGPLIEGQIVTCTITNDDIEYIPPEEPVCGGDKVYVKINTDYADDVWFGDAVAPKNDWFVLPSGASTSMKTEGVVFTYGAGDLTVDLLKQVDNARQEFAGTIEFYGAEVAGLTEGVDFYKLEDISNCGAGCYMDDFSKINETKVNIDFAVTTAHDRGIITIEKVEMPCPVNFQKYECATEFVPTNINRPSANDFDQEVPADCVLTDGYYFGYVNEDKNLDRRLNLLDVNYDYLANKVLGTTTNGVGSYDVLPGDYIFGETMADGTWIPHEDTYGVLCSTSPINGNRTNNAEKVTVTEDGEVYCVAYNPVPEEEPPAATIIATKIVCDDEAKLPDWGASRGPYITSHTATDWVAANPGCNFAEGWDFQWGTGNSKNPGDNTGKAAGLTTFGKTLSNGQASVKITDLDDMKQLWVREVMQDGYLHFTYNLYVPEKPNNSDAESAEFYCNDDSLNYDNWEWINNPKYGETYYCVAWNVEVEEEPELNNVLVKKYEDINFDGIDNAGSEPGLADWTFVVYDHKDNQVGVNQQTGPNGWTTFYDLLPGDYTVCELLQNGWISSDLIHDDKTFLGTGNEVCKIVTVYPDSDGAETVKFGNSEVEPPVLTITKSNNKPQPTVTGDVVEYTMVVTVPGEVCYLPEPNDLMRSQTNTYVDEQMEECASWQYIYDAVVTDLPPEGFEYVMGSWTAISNVRGDLTVGTNPVTPDPGISGYNSPGQWTLTDSSSFLIPGEMIELTYRTTIQDNVTNGDYPDTAFVEGILDTDVFDGKPIYGNVTSGDDFGDPFVGTQVAVIDEVEEEQGFVLGSSTLAVTGVPAIMSIAMGMLIATGAILVSGGGRKKRGLLKGFGKSFMMLALGLGLSLFVFGSAFASGFWTTNLSTPEAYTRDGIVNLDYQVSSTIADDTFTVNLLKDGSGILTETVVTNYGDSGRFPIVLPDEGTFTFKTEVINTFSGGAPRYSQEVTVTYDATAPAEAVYNGVARNGDTYTVSFTAPTGNVSSVNVFASTATSFELDDSTKVGQVAVTSGESSQFVYTAPDSTQRYFAITAQDAAGNQSTPTGDEVVTTVVTPPAGATTGTGGSTAGASDANDGTVGDDGAQAGTDVEGATDGADDGKDTDSGTSSATIIAVAVILLALVFGGAYFYSTKKD